MTSTLDSNRLSIQLARAATEAMTARGLTASDVASMAGVPVMTVQSMLMAKSSGTMSQWNKIADALHLCVFGPPVRSEHAGTTVTPWESLSYQLTRIEAKLANHVHTSPTPRPTGKAVFT